ncbi:MAG: hypothetical protein ACYCUX_07690, partial [Metallibacterium sp.]
MGSSNFSRKVLYSDQADIDIAAYITVMRRRPFSRRRTRLRIALLAVCALLFQQLALVAYACPLPSSAAPMTAMAAMPGCAGMPATGAHGAQLCAQHCAQQT